MENTIANDIPVAEQRGEQDYGKLLIVAVEIGAGILSYGGSVSRVETAVERICGAYGAAEVNVMAIPSVIQACVKMPDGREFSHMKRVYSLSNNLAMLEKYNQLSRDICANRYGVEEAEQRLSELKSSKVKSRALTVLGGGITAGAFCVYFGGTAFDGVPAFLIGALMVYLNEVFTARAFNGYARTFMMSVIGGVLTVVLCWLAGLVGLECHGLMVMIGTIMVVVPGLLICNAVRDLFTGDLLTGTFQILNGILITLAIAAGYGASLFLLSSIADFAVAPVRTGLAYYLYIIPFCMLGAFGVSLFFNLSFRRLGWAMANTLVTFIVYLLMEYFVGDVFIVNLVATLVAAVVAEVLARVVKSPASVFLIPAIIPFVPGASLYNTINYVVSGDMQNAASYGSDTALIFLGIAVGLSVVTMLFQLIYPVKNRARIKGKLHFIHKKNK